MSDTSDGERLIRQYKNLQNQEKIKQIIINTEAFEKFCYNIVNLQIEPDLCVQLLRTACKTAKFNSCLSIPKGTVVEVNGADKNILKFIFSYKKADPITIEINITDELLIKHNKLHTKTLSNVSNLPVNNETINNSQPTQNNNRVMEEKIQNLIEEIQKLNTLLIEEKEENKKLKTKITEMESKLQTPNNKNAKKRKIGTSQSVQFKNSAPMTEDEVSTDEEMIATTSNAKIQSLDHNSNNETTTNNYQITQNNSITKMKRDKNIPPIVVYDDNQKRMSERISNKNICKKNEYYYVRVNKNKYRIFVKTLDQYDKLLNLLKENNIKYHTYTPLERKNIHILFKRVASCYDANDIAEFLKNDYGLTPIHITKFQTKQMMENNIHSTMWHASFEPKTDKKRIFEVKSIGNQYGIIVEELKNNGITQCRRCWRLEHTSSNCTYNQRCIKCLEDHEIGKCELDVNTALKPTCVNCRLENHMANSKECPVYRRILDRKNNRTETTNPERQVVTETFTKPAIGKTSYANTAKNYQNNNIKSDDLKDLLKQLIIQQNILNNILTKISPQLLCENGNN